jgi:hypothetical protein
MCNHPQVVCINPYELIRKYKCETCDEVMMCACEEEFAKRFLAHQIREGTEYGTQIRIPVTLGFQKRICNTCRGLPEEAHPKAEIYRRSSKIKRYYWREIFFETTLRFADWADENGYSDLYIARNENPETYERIEKEIVNAIKELHRLSPKYIYKEESPSEVLAKNDVTIIDIDATYIKTTDRKSAILLHDKVVTSEEFGAHHYVQKGYKVMETESIPFHVLFGVFMWILIQDPEDPKVRIVSFGDRSAAEGGRRSEQLYVHLPGDFGTPGYAKRRKAAISRHFLKIPNERKELIWLFDYWLEPSERLRQYLWAHRQQDIEKAREIINILPPDVIRRILEYLIEDYWKKYTGWPDLLVYRDSEFFFVEVKSSGDSLREDQKSWIYGNTAELHLPFYLLKIHKKHFVNNEKA